MLDPRFKKLTFDGDDMLKPAMRRDATRWLTEEYNRNYKNKVYDPELFEEATSDPYTTFSIDPPSNPGCKIFRRCDRSPVGEISVAPFRELTRS